jgi:hypothetical protein
MESGARVLFAGTGWRIGHIRLELCCETRALFGSAGASGVTAAGWVGADRTSKIRPGADGSSEGTPGGRLVREPDGKFRRAFHQCPGGRSEGRAEGNPGGKPDLKFGRRLGERRSDRPDRGSKGKPEREPERRPALIPDLRPEGSPTGQGGGRPHRDPWTGNA